MFHLLECPLPSDEGRSRQQFQVVGQAGTQLHLEYLIVMPSNGLNGLHQPVEGPLDVAVIPQFCADLSEHKTVVLKCVFADPQQELKVFIGKRLGFLGDLICRRTEPLPFRNRAGKLDFFKSIG